MCPKFRPILLALSLVIAASAAGSAISQAQVNDPPTTGGTKSRYVGAAPSASPWISLGNVLGSPTAVGLGALTWASVRQPQWTIVRWGPRPARQLSW